MFRCVHEGFKVRDIINLLKRHPEMDWFPVVDVLERDYMRPNEASEEGRVVKPLAQNTYVTWRSRWITNETSLLLQFSVRFIYRYVACGMSHSVALILSGQSKKNIFEGDPVQAGNRQSL